MRALDASWPEGALFKLEHSILPIEDLLRFYKPTPLHKLTPFPRGTGREITRPPGQATLPFQTNPFAPVTVGDVENVIQALSQGEFSWY
jgi:hypothetical protein